MIVITDVELTTNNILHVIADLSGTIDFDDFTDKAPITPPSSDNKSSVRKFNVTSIADTTTYIPESSFSTLQSNKRVIPLSSDNYAIKCFEKICTTTSPKNLGKNVFIKSVFILLFSNF